MPVGVALLEPFRANRKATWEIFPYVAYSSNSVKKFEKFFAERFGLKTTTPIQRGSLPIDRVDFEKFIREIEIELALPEVGPNISPFERRALLLSQILRLGISKKSKASYRNILNSWQTLRSKNSFASQSAEKKISDSLKLLLGDLIDRPIPGFYRQIDLQDLGHWGMPQKYFADLGQDSANPFEYPLAEPDGSTFLYWSLFAFAMSDPCEYSFQIKFDWQLGRKTLTVFRKDQRGKSHRLQDFIPNEGAVENDDFAEASDRRQNAPDFFKDYAWASLSILRHLNVVSGLNVPEPQNLGWFNTRNPELMPLGQREAGGIFQSNRDLWNGSPFGSLSDSLLLAACLKSEARILSQASTEESLNHLMTSYLLELKRSLCAGGDRSHLARFMYLVFCALPQISLNEDKRIEKSWEIAKRVSTEKQKKILRALFRSTDAFEFFRFFINSFEHRDIEWLQETQAQLLTRLMQSRELIRLEVSPKSIGDMQDGLYRTYGAER